ncbi:MAG: hypothetical protein ABI780_10110 [Ardenticatenales bacterium]
MPPFLPNGNLPLGIYTASWPEMVTRFGWNAHRLRLLAGLQAALVSLRHAGCRAVYLDGSFVTTKEAPEDFDGCWDVTGVDAALLDPVLLDFADQRSAQKAKFGGELFPAQLPEGQSGMRFLEFFQLDRETGMAKGIVVIDLGDWVEVVG